MSESGVVTNLEELFLAREFGRETGRHLRALEEDLDEAPEPRELEEIFLSRDFGRPVALHLLEGGAGADETPPNVVEFPFAGPGAKSWDQPARQRAVAALSGVAAAAIVLTGLASGTGKSGPPTVSALGQAHTVQPASGGAQVEGSSQGASTLPTGTPTGNSASGSFGAPTVVFTPQPTAAVPPISSTTGFPAGVGSGSGGAPIPPPAAPAPGSTAIPPANTIVGTEVTEVGTTVTGTAGNVGSMVPPSATSLSTAMSSTGDNLTVLGESIATPNP